MARSTYHSGMIACQVASSRKSGENGLSANDHVLFYEDSAGASHVFYRSISHGWSHPKHTYGGNGSPEAYARIKDFGPAVPAVFAPGEFLPRVWRGLEHPPSSSVGLHAAEVSTRRVVGELCEQLRNAFWHVEPDISCRDSFSHALRSLLILACTEVESSWKSILRAHGYPAGRWSTNDYVKLAEPLGLVHWSLSLDQHPAWGAITPFLGWSNVKPTTSIGWYDAYNETKHDRENGLHRATLQHVVDAVAAAYVLMVAQFGWSITAEDVFRIPLARSAEVFSLASAPPWTAQQEYIAPIDDFKDRQIGHDSWTPTFLQL